MGGAFAGFSLDQAVFEGGDKVAGLFEVDGEGDFEEFFVVVAWQLDQQADGGFGLGGNTVALGVPAVGGDS